MSTRDFIIDRIASGSLEAAKESDLPQIPILLTIPGVLTIRSGSCNEPYKVKKG